MHLNCCQKEADWEREIEEEFPEWLTEKIVVQIEWQASLACGEKKKKKKMAKSFGQSLKIMKASPRSGVFLSFSAIWLFIGDLYLYFWISNNL